MKQKPFDSFDIDVVDLGTIWSFRPVSDEGKQWIKENVFSEPWQWLGSVLGVDRRMALELYDIMCQEGLSVRLN
jgi:hypothetical protein